MPSAQFPRIDAFEIDVNPCFGSSRRLMGMNRFVDGPAAILETRGPLARDADALLRWNQIAGTMASDLWGFHDTLLIRLNASAAELVIRCPDDQQYTATEVNEFAWEVAALGFGKEPKTGEFDRVHRFADASHTRRYFAALSAAEREPDIGVLRREAQSRNVPLYVDDEVLSLGAGHRSASFALQRAPRAKDIDWTGFGAIPIALVTGSNGKTTTARLLAAMLGRAHASNGGCIGLCGTGGIVIGGVQVERGDYSGPAGARTVLRDRRVTAAVLETARGGILRRGLAVDRADVAVVTNISADHFGEYGIDTLDDIAEAKLAVARPLGREGTLVLNADDAVLMHFLPRLPCRVALFSLRAGSEALEMAQRRGGLVCTLDSGALIMRGAGAMASLGRAVDMPLTVGGVAEYNIANIMAASLAAHALGVPADAIRETVRIFGKTHADNPGRLERWTVGSVNVVMDYAHNPDGLERLLRVCATLRGSGGRLLLLLGQAGNRTDEDIRALANVAASFSPERIAIKELPSMLRGRLPGEVPALLQAALVAAGTSAVRIETIEGEAEAALRLIGLARPGDVVVLPVHQSAAHQSLRAHLDGLSANLPASA